MNKAKDIGGFVIAMNQQAVRIGKTTPVESGLFVPAVQCGMVLSAEGMEVSLPLDPLVSISGKNEITRRNVAKGGTMRGTIKEMWREDDLRLTIAGVLKSDSIRSVEEYVLELLSLCQSGKVISVDCDYLRDSFGVTKIVIEDYDFPATKGMDSQSYTLKGYTDDSYELLEEV